MIEYRSFRNGDVPALVCIWNHCADSRGVAEPITDDSLDALVLSKTYFDPQGLILALDDGRPIAFAHAGFGANTQEDALEYQLGVVCAILVEPQFRRRGIGRELLGRSEDYLRSGGAQVIYAGGMHPLNPFYLGLYGGSELPGFLESNSGARPFLEACDYGRADECLVFERPVNAAPTVPDVRLIRIQRRTRIETHDGLARPTWWWAATMGPFEQVRFSLFANSDGKQLAEATIWDMHLLSQKWQHKTVGMVNVSVTEDQRRQGLGKYLVTEILRRLKQQYIAALQVQTMKRNASAVAFYESLGFEAIDRGAIYRKQ